MEAPLLAVHRLAGTVERLAGGINLWQRSRRHAMSDLETSSEEGDEWRAERLKRDERVDKVCGDLS